jgi:hypothetical protein
MDKPTQRRTQLTTMRKIYQDAHLSARQRQQQLNDVHRRIVALQTDRGVDPAALAAAKAEQVARAQLAAQAIRNTAAARSRLTDAELHGEARHIYRRARNR